MCSLVLIHENILTPSGCMLVPFPVLYLKIFLKQQKNDLTLIFISVDIRCSCAIIVVFLLYDCVSLQFAKILSYTCFTERRRGERNKGRKMNFMSNQTMKMKLTLFFTHFLSSSFLSIPPLFYHFFQQKMSLIHFSLFWLQQPYHSHTLFQLF